VLGRTMWFPFLHGVTSPACKNDSFSTDSRVLNLPNLISLTSALCVKYYCHGQKRNYSARQPAQTESPQRTYVPLRHRNARPPGSLKHRTQRKLIFVWLYYLPKW